MESNKPQDPFSLMGTGQNCLIVGSGGCGKSTLIKTHMDFFGDNTLLSAPTGIAAFNVNGSTNHKAFGLGFDVFKQDSVLSLKKKKHIKDVLSSRALMTWIGDEVGMLRADKLSEIDRILRHYRNNNEPFGGIQVCLFGDPLQLTPILKDNEKRDFYDNYKSPYFFDSPAFIEANFQVLKLQTVYRQSDPEQIKALNNLRLGENLKETLEFFNDVCYNNKSRNPESLTLAARNAEVDAINSYELSKIDSPIQNYYAKRLGDFKETPVPEQLTLKVGCRVMICINSIDSSEPYFNGSLGTVKKINRDSVLVTLDDSGKDVYINSYTWYNVDKRHSKRHNKLVDHVIGEYQQLPLRLAYAITAHKSQGLSLPSGYVDLGNKPLFATGQSYVILSRFTDLENVCFSRPLTKLDVKLDRYLVDWYNSIG